MSSTNVEKRATNRQLEHVAQLSVPTLKELRDELGLTTADVKRFTANKEAVAVARGLYKDFMRIALGRPGYEWKDGAWIDVTGSSLNGVTVWDRLSNGFPRAMITADASDLVPKLNYSQPQWFPLTWVSNEHLGLDGDEIPFEKTCTYGLLQGLKLCAGEDAPFFTLQYPGPTHPLPVPQVLRFAMTPVEGKIFTVDWHKGREHSMPCLATVAITPETVFLSKTWFAFRLQ